MTFATTPTTGKYFVSNQTSAGSFSINFGIGIFPSTAPSSGFYSRGTTFPTPVQWYPGSLP